MFTFADDGNVGIQPEPDRHAAGQITVLIASRRTELPAELSLLLANEPGIEFFNHCADKVEHISAWIDRLQPRLVLLDKVSLIRPCIEWLPILRENKRAFDVMLLCDEENCAECFSPILTYAVSGCLRCGTSPEKMAEAIRAVAGGGLWLPRELLAHGFLEAQAMMADRPQVGGSTAEAIRLTPRELSVVELVMQGLTNKEIARRLQISDDTVKKHLKHLFEKLGVHRRSQLARFQPH